MSRIRKRMLWKDIRITLAKSKGRFLSIVSLMALRSFALVGLFVTGPDMKITGVDFYGRHNLADVTVISDYALSKDDERIIRTTDGVDKAEFGYFKDVVIRNSNHSLRVYSKPESVSTYEAVEGRMPEHANEIALDRAERGTYAVGSTIRLKERPDIAGDTVLTRNDFTVVGFVDAGGIVSNLNMGQSTAGTGKLDGYAVVTTTVFDSAVTMIGRVTFHDNCGIDCWTADYRDRVNAHRTTLTKRLANQPDARAVSIREDRRAQIDKAQRKVDDAKQQLIDEQQQLDDAKTQIENGKDQLADGTIQSADQTSASVAELAGASAQIASADSQLDAARTALAAGAQQLTQGQGRLDESWTQLVQAKTQLDQACTQLAAKQGELGVVVYVRLRDVDMLAALKSVE